MRVSFTQRGDLKRTEQALQNLLKLDIAKIAAAQAQKGVRALARATPVESGLAGRSWSYKIEQSAGGVTISWLNSDIENGFPVAIRLQLGYATGTGGYVAGRDYINPAIRPIFDQIEADVWKAVKAA